MNSTGTIFLYLHCSLTYPNFHHLPNKVHPLTLLLHKVVDDNSLDISLLTLSPVLFFSFTASQPPGIPFSFSNTSVFFLL